MEFFKGRRNDEWITLSFQEQKDYAQEGYLYTPLLREKFIRIRDSGKIENVTVRSRNFSNEFHEFKVASTPQGIRIGMEARRYINGVILKSIEYNEPIPQNKGQIYLYDPSDDCAIIIDPEESKAYTVDSSGHFINLDLETGLEWVGKILNET